AIQEILSWTYTATATSPQPDFSLAISPGSQTITQGGAATYTATVTPSNGFSDTVTFSVGGLPTGALASFVPSSVGGSGSSTLTVSTGSAVASGTYPLTVKATNGTLSHTVTASLIINQTSGTKLIDFGSGFSAIGMQFNGHTKLNGSRLQLTDTTTANQVASAFWTSRVNVQSFTNDFTFQLTNANADGFTFTMQGVGPAAIGSLGGNLGYGGTVNIATSVAVKFDLHDNSGEGNNSTGLYTNGASPTVPATTITGGVNLHSGDIFQVHMTYDGTTLTMTITDATTASTFSTSWPINIPSIVGANTAYLGFTGATGGATATQEIIGWTYSSP